MDASSALAWILEPENLYAEAALAEVVGSGGAVVPGNFPTEIVHVLIVRERRGQISRLEASRAIDYVLNRLELQAEFPSPLIVADVSRKHRLTGYDAAYLALALERGVELASIDKTLSAAARAEGLAWMPSASALRTKKRKRDEKHHDL